MTTLLFPDNTVLVNFALVGRIELFADLARGRGAWTYTVSEECRRGSRVPGQESLERIPEILGSPLMATARERIDAMALRRRLASPGDSETQHYGEAECIAIILCRGEPAAFVTDDLGARRLSKALNVNTYSTWDLIRLAVRANLLDELAGWDMVCVLRAKHRKIPGMPGTEPDYLAIVRR